MYKNIAVVIVALIILVFFSLNVKEERGVVEEVVISVAACPTFYHILDNLEDHHDVHIVKTGSTSESLNLLKEREVDMIISGRALKEGEVKFLFEKIGEGYDFVFIEEVVVQEEDMVFIPFYTDLSLESVIGDFGYISEVNLTKVDDPFMYIEEGVVITRFEGLMVGEPIHVFKNDGSRVRLSRLPRAYYHEDPSEEVVILKDFLKDMVLDMSL